MMNRFFYCSSSSILQHCLLRGLNVRGIILIFTFFSVCDNHEIDFVMYSLINSNDILFGAQAGFA